MIDTQLIKQKIVYIQDDLEHLAEYKNYSPDQIASDYRIHKTVERIVELVINEAIDINQHIIINSPKKKLPFDFKESFLILVELGVYPSGFGYSISNSVGLRNILVHRYRQLDEKIFYSSIKDCLKQYTEYCRYILDYLKPSTVSKVAKKVGA